MHLPPRPWLRWLMVVVGCAIAYLLLDRWPACWASRNPRSRAASSHVGMAPRQSDEACLQEAALIAADSGHLTACERDDECQRFFLSPFGLDHAAALNDALATAAGIGERLERLRDGCQARELVSVDTRLEAGCAAGQCVLEVRP